MELESSSLLASVGSVSTRTKFPVQFPTQLQKLVCWHEAVLGTGVTKGGGTYNWFCPIVTPAQAELKGFLNHVSTCNVLLFRLLGSSLT